MVHDIYWASVPPPPAYLHLHTRMIITWTKNANKNHDAIKYNKINTREDPLKDIRYSTHRNSISGTSIKSALHCFMRHINATSSYHFVASATRETKAI